MKSEIQKELIENYKVMNNLIDRQLFNIGDAKLFLERYGNVLLKMESLEKSRDLWMKKFKESK